MHLFMNLSASDELFGVQRVSREMEYQLVGQ
jgi:hypothetical protein